jgi:hypothetical protein
LPLRLQVKALTLGIGFQIDQIFRQLSCRQSLGATSSNALAAANKSAAKLLAMVASRVSNAHQSPWEISMWMAGQLEQK